MGLNIVLGCHKHKERVWLFRGEEDAEVLRFYARHVSCAREDPQNIRISDDQSSEDWVWDDEIGWTELVWPKDTAAALCDDEMKRAAGLREVAHGIWTNK